VRVSVAELLVEVVKNKPADPVAFMIERLSKSTHK
jgi:hypothetical protein